MTISRRTLLKVLPLVASGCAARTSVTVAAVWSGGELERFQEVLDRYGDAKVFSVGDHIEFYLRRPVARAASPDVAIISRPGLIRGLGDRLQKISEAPPRTPWDRLVSLDGRVLGTWVKVAHKSLLWHREAAPREMTWKEWVDRCRELAEAGRPPLSIGAADGWVLTDWFENALLGVARQVYPTLVSQRRNWVHGGVRLALDRLAGIWGIRGLLPRGGPDRALTTQFEDSFRDVFAHEDALMVAGADFAWPIIRRWRPDARWTTFPGLPAWPDGKGQRADGPPPRVVGGDVAVAFSPEGAAFVRWLRDAGASAFDAWKEAGGLLSLHGGPGKYPRDLAALATQVQATDAEKYFDLSDRLTGYLGGGDGQGIMRVLTTFFAEVAEVEESARRDQAVERAWRSLRALALRPREG